MSNNLKQTRIGLGFDVHRFVPSENESSNTIMLCGIPVPSKYDVLANSDGDVGLHALVDALLGSIAAGDIGTHFSPNDPKWNGMSSSYFLEYANRLVHERGGEIVNIDLTIIAEKPKILPHREAMRKKLCELLTLDLDRVSIKATTTERLGFLGREEGIAVQAIVSVLV